MRLASIAIALAITAALSFAHATAGAQTSADADAIKHGYPNAKAYYCHIYGEAPLRGDTCPPEYLKKQAAPTSTKSDVCSAAWVECWNAARTSGNMAGQAQCTAEQDRCRARLGK